jgi:hypothetical protein
MKVSVVDPVERTIIIKVEMTEKHWIIVKKMFQYDCSIPAEVQTFDPCRISDSDVKVMGEFMHKMHCAIDSIT